MRQQGFLQARSPVTGEEAPILAPKVMQAIE